MTKIEEVARALSPEFWQIQDVLAEREPDVWEGAAEVKARREKLDIARAAVLAMKGPTKDMIARGAAAVLKMPPPKTQGDAHIADLLATAYDAAIDAALDEDAEGE